MSESTRTARETVDLFLQTVVEGTRDQLADLYAPDVLIEIPFAPGGVPSTTKGQDTMRARMKAAEDQWNFTSVDNVIVHETTDPAEIIVEYRIHGRATATDKDFALNYIAIMRVEDGLVVSSRDYGNPDEVAALMSGA